MRAALVTGGAGFIGSHLCDLLLEGGNKVICVDNLITGSRQNLEHLRKNPSFHFINADICSPLHLKERVDEIYNLASPASPVDFPKMPIEIMMVNSVGVRNMLDFAREQGARFLQASTSEIYGDPLEHPQRESYFGNVNPIGQRACYDESKRFAETLVVNYGKKYNMDVHIARIFNTYGPRMRANDGRVIPNFITQALQGKPITVYGDGKQTRSFCYVSDMVEGFYKLMQSELHEPVNLGNPNEMTILELAEKVRQLTGSKSQPVFRELPQGDPAKRKPEIAKARRELRWEPKVGLEEGLQKTIDYFRKFSR